MALTATQRFFRARGAAIGARDLRHRGLRIGRITSLFLAVLLPLATGSAVVLGQGLAPPAAPAQDEAPAEGATEREVPAELDRAGDEAVAERLRATFAGVDDLGGVSVAVEAGVVRLTGEVPSAAARQLAGQLARQVEGVALVENELQQITDLGRRLKQRWQALVERARSVVVVLPLVLVVILLIALFLALGRLIARQDWLFQPIDNAFLRGSARQLVRVALVLTGVLLALELLDATRLAAALLGGAGLFGLVLGFAFRDLAENAIASLLLSLRQPFAPDDLVGIEGHEGHVARLTSRATVLLTIEGNHVRIPNATVFKGVIVNYTRNPLRRFDFAAGAGVDEDLTQASQLGAEVLAKTAGVLGNPPPQAFVEELGQSNVVIRYTGWVDQRQSDFLTVRSEAIRRVKEALDEAGITLPEPTYNVRLRRDRETTTSPKSGTRRDRLAGPQDVRPRQVIERQVAVDRQQRGRDLLDPTAPSEL